MGAKMVPDAADPILLLYGLNGQLSVICRDMGEVRGCRPMDASMAGCALVERVRHCGIPHT